MHLANKGIKTEKYPIPPMKLAELERKAKAEGGDCEKAYLIFRYTAMHPSILGPYDYDSGKTNDHDIAEDKDSKDRTVIKWDRPKKEGVEAKTIILKHPNINFDVAGYAKSVKARKSKYKRSRQYFHSLMSRLGDRCGLILSPNSFRHTLAVEMTLGGVPEGVICDTLNITRSTLRRYAKLQPKERNDYLESIWGL